FHGRMNHSVCNFWFGCGGFLAYTAFLHSDQVATGQGCMLTNNLQTQHYEICLAVTEVMRLEKEPRQGSV
ncbi:MAG: hypothetical protein WCC95_21910, partial [Candidatus Sulfotelmatobacter sp.]